MFHILSPGPFIFAGAHFKISGSVGMNPNTAQATLAVTEFAKNTTMHTGFWSWPMSVTKFLSQYRHFLITLSFGRNYQTVFYPDTKCQRMVNKSVTVCTSIGLKCVFCFGQKPSSIWRCWWGVLVSRPV